MSNTNTNTNTTDPVIAALRAEFGKGTNLADIPLAEIIDTVLLVLLDNGAGNSAAEDAERIAQRLDGCVL